MRTLKAWIARAASALGVLPLLTDLYLFLRSRPWTRRADAPASDGLPLPPAWLRFSSSGTSGTDWFLSSGRQGGLLVRRLAEAAVPGGGDSALPAVLDFGCGCGRVLRHLGDLPASRIRGVDWNRRAIRWCSGNLTHASFAVGGLAPPLPLAADEDFDLIYAFSVFTHMPEDLQRAWFVELTRRLRVGGLLAISTHGDAFADALSTDERRAYDAGERVVRQPGVAGTNVCAAYHPPGSMAPLLPSGLAVESHEPEGAIGNPPQDLWLLRRRIPSRR